LRAHPAGFTRVYGSFLANGAPLAVLYIEIALLS
jgi:hypothetical protein